MDRIGDIYRNLPRRADVIVTTVGARHKCQQELENRNFDSAVGPPSCATAPLSQAHERFSELEIETLIGLGPPSCATAPLSQAHERVRWSDCRAMAARDVRQMVAVWARICVLAVRWPLGVASLVARKGHNSCPHCAPLLDDHGATVAGRSDAAGRWSHTLGVGCWSLVGRIAPHDGARWRRAFHGRVALCRAKFFVAAPPAGRRSGESPVMS
ncbi:hypothetical protein F511_35403 [Dorcoceras hygrometricum]|uniref:Uncharacterized protein n=1 Tax=Dorcoceras hygrometricum TaxID=472368 RepID=A0A2Z7ADD2_9LAMI|nr:hypothetical protein F511_35403 [Dorcoceras hygrometricum]